MAVQSNRNPSYNPSALNHLKSFHPDAACLPCSYYFLRLLFFSETVSTSTRAVSAKLNLISRLWVIILDSGAGFAWRALPSPPPQPNAWLFSLAVILFRRVVVWCGSVYLFSVCSELHSLCACAEWLLVNATRQFAVRNGRSVSGRIDWCIASSH